MAVLIKAAFNAYRYTFNDLRDTRSNDLLMMNSVWIPLAIAAFYLYFVLNLGPRLMKNRHPMQLDTVIKIYNVMQVIACAYATNKALTLGWVDKYYWFCEPVDFSNTPHATKIMKMVYLYFLIKLFDLLDTVFFVLRKKNEQISFLHVYHHAGIFIGSWFATSFFAGGHGIFLGVINCVVHIIMYSYYFITMTWPEYKKNLWWKKYVTQAQMAQFLLVAIHSLPVLFLKDCNYSKVLAGLIVFQYSFMFILFFDFYRNSYRKKTA